MKSKYSFVLVFVSLLVIPQITFASWWNPLSWFKKKEVVPVEQIIKPTQHKEAKQPEKKTETKPEIKPKQTKQNESKNTFPTTSVNSTPLLKTETTLSISNINVESTASSAYISWQTNIPTESKFLLDGKVYFSQNGVDTLHYVDVSLSSGTSYNGTIIAQANNAWVNKQITFSTKQAPPHVPTPLQINIGNKNCTSNSCKIEWQTNYPATTSITITKVEQNSVSWSFDSENNGGTGHWKTLNNLSHSTQYFFTITATYDSQSVQIEQSFRTQEPPCPANMACA